MALDRAFTKQQYEEFVYFGPCDTISHHQQKLVKTIKPHTCVSWSSDGHRISKGNYAIRETGIDEERGFVSAYLCLDCADEALKEVFCKQ